MGGVQGIMSLHPIGALAMAANMLPQDTGCGQGAGPWIPGRYEVRRSIRELCRLDGSVRRTRLIVSEKNSIRPPFGRSRFTKLSRRYSAPKSLNSPLSSSVTAVLYRFPLEQR